MPKHNPKLDGSNKKKDSREKRIREESYDFSINKSRLLMGIILFGVIIGIVVLVANVYDEDQELKTVEKYDLVLLDYSIYTLDQYQENEDPTIRVVNVWVNACHRYDENCRCDYEGNSTKDYCEESLVLGFYNELLGKRETSSEKIIYLEACIDEDMDGIDDFSGADALSYGHPKDTLYDTDIVIKYRIKDIQKKKD